MLGPEGGISMIIRSTGVLIARGTGRSVMPACAKRGLK